MDEDRNITGRNIGTLFFPGRGMGDFLNSCSYRFSRRFRFHAEYYWRMDRGCVEDQSQQVSCANRHQDVAATDPPGTVAVHRIATLVGAKEVLELGHASNQLRLPSPDWGHYRTDVGNHGRCPWLDYLPPAGELESSNIPVFIHSAECSNSMPNTIGVPPASSWSILAPRTLP